MFFAMVPYPLCDRSCRRNDCQPVARIFLPRPILSGVLAPGPREGSNGGTSISSGMFRASSRCPCAQFLPAL
jgi:hypothetical protein